MVFLVFLLVPCIPAIFALFLSQGRLTKKEFILQVVIQAAIAGITAFIIHHQSMHDVELWNGRVAAKSSAHVSCIHSYDCNCKKDSKGRESCDTCYDHPYDVDWNVYTSNNETIPIDRIDRQGVMEPPRFSAVRVGEPTTVKHGYRNYVKAAPDSLFRHQGLKEKYQSFIPPYPNHVFDYFHADKFVTVGFDAPDGKVWDAALEKLNGDIGAAKQANIIIVAVRNQPPEYFYALEEAWVGAKKNDIVLVVGVDDGMVPQWATVMCWTSSEIFKVQLRDDVLSEGGTLDVDKVMVDLKKDVTQYFVRKPMADFQYLEASITPTTGQWAGGLFVSFFISIGMTIVCIKVDIFGEERSPWNRSRNQTPLFASKYRDVDAFERSLRGPFWRRK